MSSSFASIDRDKASKIKSPPREGSKNLFRYTPTYTLVERKINVIGGLLNKDAKFKENDVENI